MRDLFLGAGIAHSILVFAVVIAIGLYLGKFKIKGISIGSTWILFVAILLSHFGLRVDTTVMNFMKDFGLILFVFRSAFRSALDSSIRSRRVVSN